MKNLLFNLLCLFSLLTVFSVPSAALWDLQASGTTENLYSIHFVNNNTGFAAGSGGVILKSTNGGTSWFALVTGTSHDIYGVRFTNTAYGIAVGDSGLILRTTNGGTNWAIHPQLTENTLRSVFFINTRTGWIAGDSVVLKTTNRGLSWVRQTADTGKKFYSVFFINANTGWITGYGILKTTNGGTTWLVKLARTDGRSIFFSNANTGWYVGGSYKICRSTDGGESWGAGFSGPEPESPPAIFTGISFINTNTGWFTSSHAFGGRVLMTTDGGANWTEDYPTTYNRRLFGIFMRSSTSGWAVGERGTILKRSGLTGISANENGIPDSYSLSQNYPNPFNPATVIEYSIPKDEYVTLRVYDISGREVTVLINNEMKRAGSYKIDFNASGLSSGVYFYGLSAGSLTENRKMVLIK